MKKKERVEAVFIILHYKNINDTIECINSIRTLEDKNYKIIVVDNNSGVEEDDRKLKTLVDDLIILEENIGFAKGNNKGIELAREKYQTDFMIVINNDTLLTQKDLLKRIQNIYKEHPFDALGFKILTNEGDSVNPFPVYDTLDKVNKAIDKSEMLLGIYNSKFKRFLLRTYSKIKRLIKKPSHLENADCFLEDVALHGCAIIFSKRYYEKYKDCFYSHTFLYHEEEFLNYRRRKDNLKFIYDPNIEIFHKEGSSLNYDYNDDLYRKLIFRESNILKSLKLLKEVMIKNKKI